MRVLHVIAGLRLGGAETLLYRLTSRLSDIEHEVICLGPPDWYTPLLQRSGIPVRHVPGWRVCRLLKFIEASDPDVVQTWMYRPNLIGGLLARLAGKPVVWGIHCSSPGTLPLTSQVVARAGGLLAFRIADFVINCSTSSAALHTKLGFARARGAVIHNGFNANVFFPDETTRKRVRESLGVAPDVFLIGSITRWIQYKDIPTLLRALRMAADAGIHLRCVLLGQNLGRDNDRLVEAIAECECSGLVVPLGMRSDVPELARAMDIHVLSSVTEAFPNVIAETMLSGAPNIATDVGDSAFMIGQTGWIVPPGEAEQMATAILQAYKEWKERPLEWNNRRAAARARIAENFTLDRMAEAYDEVWREVARSATEA